MDTKHNSVIVEHNDFKLIISQKLWLDKGPNEIRQGIVIDHIFWMRITLYWKVLAVVTLLLLETSYPLPTRRRPCSTKKISSWLMLLLIHSIDGHFSHVTKFHLLENSQQSLGCDSVLSWNPRKSFSSNPPYIKLNLETVVDVGDYK